ncbi:LOW QUALITY PROTEIN: coiled-coil and C2 domain-containing protein 1A [Harpia harpyja]|uniref:LOW QUALITY PROTEIN: coiled-coil and C2 domain-containing protein 1A n=1 Tax=Harpia harpyja TaxID=202280 RepID=UPI0022B12BC1|nr:LOW QUALITY PROTEIN: coiled-coil and C2 domain-containing protein 1A [Harpia harpyja]
MGPGPGPRRGAGSRLGPARDRDMSKARRMPPGHGAVIARQMGLLVDLSPEGTAGDDTRDDAAELEAELLALVGGRAVPGEKPKGKTPLPMEAIEKMAALCMKDTDEEEEGDDEEELEDEDDLMAELQEVLGEGEGSTDAPVPPTKVPEAPPEPSDIESTLAERADMYRTAIANAKQAGDSSRVRRYERGLKTLENMLASVKKGKKINEEEIPPPVALGKGASSPQPSPASPLPAACPGSPQPPPQPPAASASKPQPPPKSPKASGPARQLSGGETISSLAIFPPRAPTVPAPRHCCGGRQREYKLAALHAKQRGDLEMATKYYRVAKSFDSLLEAAGNGQPVELSSVPPPPDQLPKELSPGQPQPAAAVPVPEVKPASPAAAFLRLSPKTDVPPPPRDVLEALQQRMERYKTAAAQAKSKGDDRKARMHERIVKQYQDAIRAHKAGKTVDFLELPVPPGFQPIQGMETPSGDQSIAGVLETAMKLASQEVHEEEDGAEKAKPPLMPSLLFPAQPAASPAPVRAAAASQPKQPPPPPQTSSAGAPNSAGVAKPAPKTTAKAQQQLAFLEGRRKQLMQAALRAKQKNDIEGAKLFLRQAKGLDPMIEASQNGLPVDITKVPEAPVNKEDFVLVQRRGVHISPEAASQYLELMKLIRQQHEMCMNYSKQFTHLGNIAETTKFEKLAEDCKQNMEILKQAHARGFPLPKYHYEQRTFSVIKIFPELNSNDMVLSIVKGINLPAPPGVAPNDLDAFVRFEFPYPNAEEAQKDKTNVIKNTDCPEFKEQFKLYMNRGHRGLRRVLQTKGIKFEVAHKGGLFKTDRVIGTAQLKLEALETACEVREIIELLDGRRPTGGKLEVIVRIREPLSSQQLETRTERWLVINPSTMPPVAVPKPKPVVAPAKEVNNRRVPGGCLASAAFLDTLSCSIPSSVAAPTPNPGVSQSGVSVLAVADEAGLAAGERHRVGIKPPPALSGCRRRGEKGQASHGGEERGPSRAVPALPSLNLLAFDQEKLERKMLAYRQAQRPVPPELREQYQDIARRSQILRSRLQHGDPPFRKEYLAQLERYLQLYTETARRLGTEGNRDAAKEALYKRNLVESELQKFRR